MTSPAPFTEHDYDGEEFIDVAFTEQTLRDVRFDGCTFRGCDFSKATLSECRFEECHFVLCDMTMVKLPNTRLVDVQFDRCKLMGVDFTLAYDLGFEVAFEGCVLSYAAFIGMSLRGLRARECRCEETNFEGADLTGANFDECDMRGAVFVRTDLRDADLSASQGVCFAPADNRVKKTRLSLGDALAVAATLGVVVPGHTAK